MALGLMSGIQVLKALWLIAVMHLPGDIGFRIRHNYWKNRLRFLGTGVLIDTGVYFCNPGYIEIDDNCWIDKGVVILAGLDNTSRERIDLENEDYKGEPGVVRIGKNAHIGVRCIISGISAGVDIADDCTLSAHCAVYAFTHHYRSWRDPGDSTMQFGSMAPVEKQCMLAGPVYLGPNTGVALNSVILPGVAIRENSFVAINSVIKHGTYEGNSILSGNPAVRIDSRFRLE